MENVWLAPLMFIFTLICLCFGFPVAFTLSGSALLFGLMAFGLGSFDPIFLSALPERIFGILTNESLVAIPLFVFMGLVLEGVKISEDLLLGITRLFARVRGGLAISVFIVGALLAASTGIVGATVVSMGLISLPLLLKKNYPAPLATGMICASGTLGQIIPPSLVLIILGDVMGSANQQAQINSGAFEFSTVSVGDLFTGALIPGLLLVSLYILYVVIVCHFNPKIQSLHHEELDQNIQQINLLDLGKTLLPPLLLVITVLGSIISGIATPTEAASVGSIGVIIIALCKQNLTFDVIKSSCDQTLQITSMVFAILIGASVFSIVFRGIGGDEAIHNFLLLFSDQAFWCLLAVLLFIFILGFFLDFFEICFVVVPIVGPVLIQLGYDPIWLGVMIAMNLQTSFLTPPFGFSLFYLRGVAPDTVTTRDIYLGVWPFIGLQVLTIALIWIFPWLVLRP